jgi:putative IMPACT (imprinted ancient) family translation regulator
LVRIEGEDDVAAGRAEVVELKKVAKATHPCMMAYRVGQSEASMGSDDDGESGAGAVLLKVLEDSRTTDHMVCVTRWYGGRPMGPSRFRAIASVAHKLIKEHAPPRPAETGRRRK